VRGGGVGDVSKSHTLWKHKSKAVDHLCSPLVADGDDPDESNGLVSAYEIGAGSRSGCGSGSTTRPRTWRRRCTATARFYAAADNGKIVVMASGPEYQEPIAINDMGESCVGTPAIVDGRLYIRTRNHLYCIAK